MKRLNVLLFAMAITAMSGCSVIGGIFKAGAISGILAVVVVIVVIIIITGWIMSTFKGE